MCDKSDCKTKLSKTTEELMATWYIRRYACACRWRVHFAYPSVACQVVLIAQFKRLFLFFLPIVPSEQIEALPAAQKPTKSLQRHSNGIKLVVFNYPGPEVNIHTLASGGVLDKTFSQCVNPESREDMNIQVGHPLHRPPRGKRWGTDDSEQSDTTRES